MTNDAKLGLLAGVAGVVAAALFPRPADVPAPPPPQAAVSAQPANPPRVAGSVPSARPDLEARPVSRPSDED